MDFDLLAALPQLLPEAIKWAEAQSEIAAREGQSLAACDLSMARGIGVKRSELIRIRVVDQLPFPDEPSLKEAALQTGLLGPETIGLTLGHSIFMLKGHLGLRLLSHECRHVYQYEEYGSIAAFLPIYLNQIATFGYDDAPLERDARAYERETKIENERRRDDV